MDIEIAKQPHISTFQALIYRVSAIQNFGGYYYSPWEHELPVWEGVFFISFISLLIKAVVVKEFLVTVIELETYFYGCTTDKERGILYRLPLVLPIYICFLIQGQWPMAWLIRLDVAAAVTRQNIRCSFSLCIIHLMADSVVPQ